CQSVKSKSENPVASATVGISGAACERAPDETASTFTVPAFISGITGGKPGKYISTWPPMMSFRAGPAPLYGTCTSLPGSFALRYSPARRPGLPLPAEANENGLVDSMSSLNISDMDV